MVKTKFKRFVILIFVILTVFNLMITPALAQPVRNIPIDEDDMEDEGERDEQGRFEDRIPDEFEEKSDRISEIESLNDNEIRIKSRIRAEGDENIEEDEEDEIEFEFIQNTEGIEIEIEYKSNINDLDSEFKLKIKFEKIVEFEDLNSDNQLDDGDSISQEYLIDSFFPIEYGNETINEISVLHQFHLSTDDGVFQIYAQMSEEFTNLSEEGDQIITPMELKFDISIQVFPFLMVESKLALLTKIITTSKHESREETINEAKGLSEGEEEIVMDTETNEGYFSWSETCLDDGVEAPVYVSEILPDESNSDNEIMYFIYPHSTNIYHDPKLGMSEILQTTDLMDTYFYIYVFLALVLLSIAVKALLEMR